MSLSIVVVYFKLCFCLILDIICGLLLTWQTSAFLLVFLILCLQSNYIFQPLSFQEQWKSFLMNKQQDSLERLSRNFPSSLKGPCDHPAMDRSPLDVVNITLIPKSRDVPLESKKKTRGGCTTISHILYKSGLSLFSTTMSLNFLKCTSYISSKTVPEHS